MIIETCALCKIGKRIEKSHIIPAFVYRFIVKTSPTTNLRDTSNPNHRVRDGVKLPFLCSDCEDIFSKLETYFAENVFHKIHSKREKEFHVFKYDQRLHKFCVSVVWRSIAYMQEIGKEEDNPRHHVENIKLATENWRKYLLGENVGLSRNKIHMVILPPYPSLHLAFSKENYVDLFNYYNRSIDYNTICSTINEESYIISKLCRILIVGSFSKLNEKSWQNTYVNPNGGLFYIKKPQITSSHIWDHIKYSVMDLNMAKHQLSKKQSEKISTDMSKIDLKKWINDNIS